MHKGHYISGAGHLGLIGWALFGSLFTAEPLPFETVNAVVVSGEEYAAMMRAQQSPETATDLAEPAQPEAAQPEPRPVPTPDAPPPRPEAPQAATAEPDRAPEALPDPTPPVAEVDDTPPEIQQPSEDVAVLLPPTAPRAVPRPSERVAPVPVAKPEPERDTAPEIQPQTAPTPALDRPAPEQQAAAPEEASTQIVPEAAEPPSGAPAAAKRPKARPPVKVAEAPKPSGQAARPATEDTTAADVASAVAASLQGSQPAASSAPSGPPLTQGDRDGLRVAVEACWVVDVGSQAANVTVVVGMKMNRDGTVITNSIELLSAKGGDSSATEIAFQAARRAILRCQKTGYKLPIEKFDHWREIEMTFNPEKMRSR